MLHMIFVDEFHTGPEDPLLFPVYIIGNKNELIRVYPGINLHDPKDGYGLFVTDEDYEKIPPDDKVYWFVHNADATNEDVIEMKKHIDEAPEFRGEKCSHIHISKYWADDIEQLPITKESWN